MTPSTQQVAFGQATSLLLLMPVSDSGPDNLELSLRSKIPNALSCSRIVMALGVLLLSRKLTVVTFTATLGLVAAAFCTDALDGYLARRWRVTSETGYVLDAMGDRALHLALILVVLVRYAYDPIFAWLLIFRDIAIYAIRVLSPAWLEKSRKARWLSVLHATNVRIWLCSYLARDAVRVFAGCDCLATRLFTSSQLFLIVATIALSYWGIFRSFEWLLTQGEP